MRDPARIDRVLEMLKRVWHDNPDMRFGQLVMNLYRDMGTVDTEVLWNREDDRLEDILDQLLRTKCWL